MVGVVVYVDGGSREFGCLPLHHPAYTFSLALSIPDLSLAFSLSLSGSHLIDISLSLGFSLSRFLSLGFSLPRPRTPPPALPFGRTPIHQRQTSRRMSHRCRLRSRAAAPPGGARARGAPGECTTQNTPSHRARTRARAHARAPRHFAPNSQGSGSTCCAYAPEQPGECSKTFGRTTTGPARGGHGRTQKGGCPESPLLHPTSPPPPIPHFPASPRPLR